MSGLLKKFLFGIWGLLLIPLIAPVLKKWLEENVFSGSMAATAFRDATATPVFTNLLELGQQPWFRLMLVFLTGVVAGVSLEWLNRKSGEKNAAALRSLGWKFRSLSECIRIRSASPTPGWPDNARDIKPAMLSVLGAARKLDVWAPNEHVYQLPDATFLCEYLRCVGRFLEDGDFEEARREANSWRPFLDQGRAPG